jgi:cyanophycin synthetase
VIENIDDKRLKTIIFPIVVKPLHGSGWKGVSVGIKNKEELKLAINHAKNYCPQVLIEEQILGHDYRFLVIWEKVFVAKRIPAWVIGDGISTIKELIKTENNIREKQEYNLLSSIKIDLELENTLKNWGYTLDSIPKNHENILLRKNANLSSWGTVIDYTNNIHPENTKLALKIAKKMGMKIIAIDFLFQDVSKKFSKQNWIVIEINSTPWIRLHHPREEEVVENIFKLLFPWIKKKKN